MYFLRHHHKCYSGSCMRAMLIHMKNTARKSLAYPGPHGEGAIFMTLKEFK